MGELEKTYDPKKVEDKIYRLWEESGFFNPDKLPISKIQNSKFKIQNFCIIMPPPNANGALHIGHAVFVTLQDIMIRFNRMRGHKTLWLPGADHAGFETQVVFEKKLEKEGRSRFNIPRDQLFKEMLEFTLANKVVMENQLKKLGASCDWSREKFTLDPDIVEIVTGTFVKLYDDGLIYRGERVVNWCVKHQTALSDLEVKYEERNDPLYYIKYGPLVLATARPETKFGDTAVAVHPGDKRYKKYIGKELEIETLLGPAKIKVIADKAVDPDFGTGVVKVTPAHDPADFEIGQRHNLEVRQVIGKDGRLNEKAGPYAGLKVAEAREKVAGIMQARGLMQKIDATYQHNVAVCYKCGGVLEPLVMPQWFVATTKSLRMQNAKIKNQNFGKSLRDMAVDAVKSGKIKFVPKRFEKVFFHWMKNIRDWNISRQITWGIRIPAWFCVSCGDAIINPAVKGNWFFVRHGETDWNVEHRIQGQASNVSLNERGRVQARAAAKQLAKHPIDLIISSDSRRARETAEIIAKELGVEMICDKALRERSYGVLEGKTYREIGDEELERLRYQSKHAPDGGESLLGVEERVRQALARHRDRHNHKNIAVVSHGTALRMMLGKLKGLKLVDDGAVHLENAGITHFAVAYACKKCGSDFIEQDPDVLDTWFSSGQWPYATLLASGRANSKFEIRNSKLKKETKDFKTFYPTDVLETGWDILFFWVARMIMFGLYCTGQVPFRTVYLHGLVRDKDRQKMSKSKGNVIDPLGVAAEYGTDAVRMALTVGNVPGNDIVISEEKIRGYRNFVNKLWNIQRFIILHSDAALAAAKPSWTAEDKKRLTELKSLSGAVTNHIEKFQFYRAAEKLYNYTWHTFADKVIESAKSRLAGSDAKEKATAFFLLLEIHSTILKLLHPFMPFITEELWSHLPHRGKIRGGANLLMVENWPAVSY